MPKYTKEDLLKRLNAGETKDVLGTEIADYLNELAAQYTADLNEAVSAHVQEKFEAERAEADKLAYADMLAEDMSTFLHIYYPECVDEKEELFTGTDLIELCDIAKELVQCLKPLMAALAEEQPTKEPAGVDKKTTSKGVSKAEIQKFLKEMGL